jgi:hypothetical protein
MKTIVILSGVPFESTKQRPQHFASFFAKKGYEVIYLFLYDNDKIDPEFLLSVESRKALLSLFTKSQDKIFYLKKKQSHKVINKPNSLSLLIKEIINIYGKQNVTFICSFPEWIVHLISIPWEVNLIYDCIDDWEEFINDVDFSYTETLVYNERKIASKANLVITSSKKLYIKMSYYNNNIYYLPNGVWNKDYFLNESTYIVPYDLQEIKQPIVFFMGVLAEWVDMELIHFTAKSRPNYSFVFIGNERVPLPKLPNIYFLGRKDYKELPYYLASSKVAIIPFKLNRLTAAVTPLKFYEYLGSGTPVVTTILPDLLDLPGSKVALNKYQFTTYIDYYINVSSDDYQKETSNAKETAKLFDWEVLLNPLVSLIEGKNYYIKPKDLFIQELTISYNRYRQNPFIKNELLAAYTALEKYEEAVSLFDDKWDFGNACIDYEKLALSHFKLKNDVQAKQIVQLSLNNRNKYINKYVDNLFEYGNKTLINIYLLKLSGNIYGALELTDKLIQRNGKSAILLGLLTGLLLDIGEYSLAIQAVLETLEYIGESGISYAFDFPTLCFLVKYLTDKSEYNLAEDLALHLIQYDEEVAVKLLSDIYLCKNLG